MLKRGLLILTGVSLLGATGGWWAVTTDHWPLDDRKLPARLAWDLNRVLSGWLLTHAESVPLPARPEVREPLTQQDLAAVMAAIKADPRLRDRDFTSTRLKRVGPPGGRG